MKIKPVEDRIDTNRITFGVMLIVIYALSSVYLISRPVQRYIHSQDRSRHSEDRQAVALSSGLRQIDCGGKRILAASSAVLVDAMNPSSSAAASIPVWPIRSRTSAEASMSSAVG